MREEFNELEEFSEEILNEDSNYIEQEVKLITISKEEQIEIFKRQLMIAESLHMPVIVHSRESILDTYNLLNEYKLLL